MVSYGQAVEYIRNLGFAGRVASNVVLVQEALNRRIDVSKTKNGRGFLLEYDGRKHWWRGGNSSLNTSLAKRVTQYKSVTSALLSAQGLATTAPTMFRENDIDIAWAWAEKNGPVVIKPDDSQGGEDVFLDIHERKEFYKRFAYITHKHTGSALVEPYYRGDQMRFLVVNGKVVATALMRPANIIGDGRSTIEKLAKAKNKQRANHESHELLTLTERETRTLAQDKFDLMSVPEKGRRVFLSRVSNLQQGGDAVEASKLATLEQVELAEKVATAIPGLKLAGIDMLLPDDNEVRPQMIVLEVNCSPQLSIHHFPWEGSPINVAEHVLNAFFPTLAQN